MFERFFIIVCISETLYPCVTMGRKSKKRVVMSQKNTKSIMERWKSTNEQEPNLNPALGQTTTETVSETLPSNQGKTSDDEEPAGKKTGFALYHSYNDNIDVDENATTYLLVDKDQLTAFVRTFPCPDCLSVGSVVLETLNVNGFANTFKIYCSECAYSSRFDTSARIQQKAKTPSFDVNRRMVQAFSSMGKGLRGIETFSMYMNMKSIQNKSYNAHKKALLLSATQSVEKIWNLRAARFVKLILYWEVLIQVNLWN